MFTIDDYILVSRNGKLYKSSLANLHELFLPVNDDDKIDELTQTIDEISSYILELSATAMNDYTPIVQLDSKYEMKLSTDYMKSDETILIDDTIENMIADSGIVTKEKVEDSYSNSVDKCENEFEKAQNKLDSKWFD